MTMRRLVFGLGGLQVAVTAAAIGGIVALAGHGTAASIIVGSCLALSSTAFVIEVLSNQKRLKTTVGRTSFAVLLAQDLAVVPILLLVPFLAAGPGGNAVSSVLLALVNAAAALGLIVIVGQLLLRPLFRLVASSGTRDLFVAATLFVIVGTGMIAGLAGVSMALGAFVAGLLLAETEYGKAVETTVDPFKGLLLGIFFFSVGLSIDFRELAREPALLIACAAGLIAIKFLILAPLARLFDVPWPAAVETGLVLGAGGEFAFVVIGAAVAQGLIDSETSSFTLVLTSLTMALIPLLAMLGRAISRRIDMPKAIDPMLAVAPKAGKGHAIVMGHGRVGQVVCALLERHRFPFIAIDSDPAAVTGHRRRGREVYYGDATSAEFLKSCGLLDAAAVIVTSHSQAVVDETVRVVRALRPDILIISRARDAGHARHLYGIGVSDAVPETIEASLQLSEATLVGLGVPAGPVIASIHEMRDEFRKELQQAAGQAGIQTTRSIRPKTTSMSARGRDA
jgi:CPA2 family monovalent cation:H+ antiporter-2